MEQPGAVATQSFEGWAILELMGHRRLGGFVREQVVFGAAMCRIDIPAVGDYPAATQFYAPSALYCVTPCDEDTAKAVAAGYQPAPVNRWELPALSKPSSRSRTRDLYDDGDEDDDT